MQIWRILQEEGCGSIGAREPEEEPEPEPEPEPMEMPKPAPTANSALFEQEVTHQLQAADCS